MADLRHAVRALSPRTLIAALAVVVLVLVVANALLWRAHEDVDAEREAGNGAVDAALDAVPVVLSYAADTVDDDLADGADLLTGAFRAEYVALGASTITPAARKDDITTSAVVTEAGVVDVRDTGTVDLLLFVNQTVVRGDQEPVQTGTRIEITMERSDGRWLISALDPV